MIQAGLSLPSETASGGLRGETNMKWPQFVMAGLLLADVFLTTALHGEPKTGNYDIGVTLISNLVVFGILYAGGFWG